MNLDLLNFYLQKKRDLQHYRAKQNKVKIGLQRQLATCFSFEKEILLLKKISNLTK